LRIENQHILLPALKRAGHTMADGAIVRILGFGGGEEIFETTGDPLVLDLGCTLPPPEPEEEFALMSQGLQAASRPAGYKSGARHATPIRMAGGARGGRLGALVGAADGADVYESR
jgi:hypothetical protein